MTSSLGIEPGLHWGGGGRVLSPLHHHSELLYPPKPLSVVYVNIEPFLVGKYDRVPERKEKKHFLLHIFRDRAKSVQVKVSLGGKLRFRFQSAKTSLEMLSEVSTRDTDFFSLVVYGQGI